LLQQDWVFHLTVLCLSVFYGANVLN